MKVIETMATLDAPCRLSLDEPVPMSPSARVRVLVLLPEDGDINETEWLIAMRSNPAFEFLRDPQEDVYSVQDGVPFHDKG